MVNRTNRNNKYTNNKNKTSKMVSDSRKFNQNGVKKRLGNNLLAKGISKKQGVVKDARQKIKAKQQRRDVVDARDILAKLAKTQDARGKILKMRENSYNSSKVVHQVRPIGANIIRRTDANGKICLLTNKTKSPTTNMNLAIQQQLGILPHSTSRMLPKKTSYVTTKKQPQSHAISRSHHPSHQMSQAPPPPPTVIRKTIHNNYTTAAPMPHPMHQIAAPAYMAMDNVYSNGTNLFKWLRKEPNVMPVMRGGGTMISDPTSGNWITYAQQMRSAPMPSSTYTIDVDDDPMDIDKVQMHQVPIRGSGGTHRHSANSSNVHSRLDGSPESPPLLNTHGVLSQTKTKVVVPVGHRIVVSNLQGTVTQDDIRELFEDIGQLLVARLVRPGTAEVIYKNLKDAQKAVDTYHNRQLDGQPMKCLLVNKRPANNPTAPAISSPAVRKMPAVNAANKLVPDLSTIHKVLFQRN